MPEITERIEKQMEGTNLALAAVAEILQKMDVRFSKEEQDVVAQEQQSAQDAARADLVKSIAGEVLSVLKGEGNDQGMDVDPSERKAKPTGGTPQNADDSESSVTENSKIEDQQSTIQAMKKLLKNLEGDEKDKEEEDTEKGGMAYKDDDVTDEEAADIPVEEEDEKNEEGYMDDEEKEPDMKSMQKQLRAMKKELKASKDGIQKQVQTEAEDRLRKMGFREENGLQKPALITGAQTFGVEDTTPLAKATGDVAGQLAELSYTELRRMQEQIATGNIDGLPKELIN